MVPYTTTAKNFFDCLGNVQDLDIRTQLAHISLFEQKVK